MLKIIFIVLVLLLPLQTVQADSTLTVIKVQETAGLERGQEYLEIPVTIDYIPAAADRYAAVDDKGNITICQSVLTHLPAQNRANQILLVFPVSLPPYGNKLIYLRKINSAAVSLPADLHLSGDSTELIIENEYYRADLTKSSLSEAKNHDSGQLRELLIKMGINQLLFRTENRMHWAPNFQKEGAQEYQTIAQWDSPGCNVIDQGPYLIRTIRQAPAPDYPEIMLTAVYKFPAGKPYFIFYSEISIIKDITLTLLRNDEMTMDSMFTHVAFKRPDGRIENMTFEQRAEYLSADPVENDAPWICFYNQDRNFGFGSIRLIYDNNNSLGESSPLFMPHTKVSDGAGGGKYWNRRLINEHPVIVPAGSRYAEENAYLVFKTDQQDGFKALEYWSQRLTKPVIWKIIGTAEHKY